MEHVGELINGRLVSIGPTARVSEAAELIARERVSHLLVTRGEELLGILCACDLDRAARDAAVDLAMSRELFTIDADATPEKALASMHEHGVSCLPVLSRGVARGVVTLHDLVRLGIAQEPEHCSACGSTDHVRCMHARGSTGLCLECARRSEPPSWDEDVGGGG